MTIKRVHQSDFECVVDLFDQYRVFYEQKSDLSLARSFIEQRLANQESVIFVAIDSALGVPIGFTQLYPKFSSARATKNWILNDLFVVQESRKKGVGEQLIRRAMNFAASDGATFLNLSTAVTNRTAQRLYEQIGFDRLSADTQFYDYRIALLNDSSAI